MITFYRFYAQIADSFKTNMCRNKNFVSVFIVPISYGGVKHVLFSDGGSSRKRFRWYVQCIQCPAREIIYLKIVWFEVYQNCVIIVHYVKVKMCYLLVQTLAVQGAVKIRLGFSSVFQFHIHNSFLSKVERKYIRCQTACVLAEYYWIFPIDNNLRK